MTSFDPEAEQGPESVDEPEGPEDAAQPGTAAPAERPVVGNGSARTTARPGAGGARQPSGSPDADAPAEEPPEDAGGTSEGVRESGEADPATQVEAAKRLAAEYHDRFLRTQAEFENYKKRIAKEHADSLRYALTPLVTEMAAILDNLERATEHARKEEAEAGALLAGIEMVVKQMHEALARFGVTRIEAVGRPFDPELHEAMAVVERDDVPANQVLEEFQAGYLLHDRVIRPARVTVSKPGNDGGAKGTEAPPEGG